MRTDAAIVFALALFLAAFTSGCSDEHAEANSDNDKAQARLVIKGSPGIEFSGSCTIGDEEPREIGGEVPKSFTYELEGRSLDCEISSEGDLQVELAVGKGARSVQSISGGTLKFTYKDGSISSVTASSSQVSSSASRSTQEPNGKRKESRNVSGFEEVELRGVGNLSIEQTGSESLTIEAEDDVIPKLKTRVINNRLIIASKPDTIIQTTEPINYKLTVKNLSALEVQGTANIEAEDIKTHRLAVIISGAGNVKTTGEADEQQINLSGSSIYRAEDLESKEVRINVAGAGSAVVNVSEELDAEISGVGSVEYIGDPTVKQDVIGAGRVRKH
jgi:Putative auto-transporter adhesin, head GIN domain